MMVSTHTNAYERPDLDLKPRDARRPRAFSNLRPARSTSGPSTVSSPVTHSLASEAWTTKEHAVGPSRVQLSELIEGDDLTARSEDACASSLGDTQSTDLETLGALEHAHIVGDSAHDHSHLALP